VLKNHVFSTNLTVMKDIINVMWHELQLLGTSFLKCLKGHYNRECNIFMTVFQDGRKIITLISNDCSKKNAQIATTHNAQSGFRSTTTFSINQYVLFDLEFKSSKALSTASGNTQHHGPPNHHLLAQNQVHFHTVHPSWAFLPQCAPYSNGSPRTDGKVTSATSNEEFGERCRTK
jgi:hypothetical protein